MVRVRSEFVFEINSMWVAEDALGKTLSFTRDGWEVEIKLPFAREDFGLYRPEWVREYPEGPFGGGTSGRAGTSNFVRQVTAIQVTVWGDAKFRPSRLIPAT